MIPRRVKTKVIVTILATILLLLFDCNQPVTWIRRKPFYGMRVLAQTQDALLAEAKRWLQQGNDYYNNAQLEAANQAWQKALELYQKLSNTQGEGLALGNLGIIQRELGNYSASIDYLNQALEIQRELGNRQGEGIARENLGNTYAALGEYKEAVNYYEDSLEIAEERNDIAGKGSILANMGIVNTQLGEYEKATINYEQSLSIAKQIQNYEMEGNILHNLGIIYQTLGQVDKAFDYYRQSLLIARSRQYPRLERSALGSLGLGYRSLGDYITAIEYYKQSLAIARQMQDPRETAMALNNLGSNQLKAGQLVEAEKSLREAIGIWDFLRTSLDNAYQISMFDTLVTYNLLQQVLVNKTEFEKALESSEHGRTRAFVDLLSKRLSLQSDVLPSSKPPTLEEIKQIAKTQNATLVEYSIIPEDKNLHHGKSRGLGKELYIWVVQPTGQIEFRRINIESLDSPLEELVAIGRTCIIQHECRGNANYLTPNVGDFVRLNNDENDVFKAPWIVKKVNIESRIITVTHPTYDGDVGEEYSISDVVAIVDSPHAKKERLHQLHKLLIEPINDLLPTDPESPIIFIPQGELFLIPFPAIQNSEGTYLIEKHTIMTAPSIQILDFTHKRRNARMNGNNFNSALVVGNPTMPTVPLQDSPLDELPKAEEEAKNIVDLLNDKGITAQAITGSQATKVDILKQMPNAPLIHLATHGLLDDIKQLGVPGAIALAPSEGDNGFLTSGEILNLKLNAQLVVLSACDTGKGEITGDGVIGLSRSFIAAGVPSVVVSLWSVPDAPTGLLMTEFYRQFLTTGDKAQALRQAMLKIMQNPEYQDPWNWAAFTLIGESKSALLQVSIRSTAGKNGL